MSFPNGAVYSPQAASYTLGTNSAHTATVGLSFGTPALTYLDVTLTCSGIYPVYIFVGAMESNSATAESRLSWVSAAAFDDTTVWIQFRCIKDSLTVVSRFEYLFNHFNASNSSSRDHSIAIPELGLVAIDEPTAGSHQYQMQAATSHGTATYVATMSNMRMLAMEMRF